MTHPETTMRTLILALLLSSTAVFAQTAGDATRGNTPPGKSQDGSGPADGALKGGSIQPGEGAGVPNKDSTSGATERLKRCEERRRALREDWLYRRTSGPSGTGAPRPRNKGTPCEPEPAFTCSPSFQPL